MNRVVHSVLLCLLGLVWRAEAVELTNVESLAPRSAVSNQVPDTAKQHAAKGAELVAAAKHEAAEREFRAAVQLDPTNADAMLNWAWTLLVTKQPDEALNALNKALRLKPDHPGAGRIHLQIAEILTSQGKREQSLEALRKSERAAKPDDLELEGLLWREFGLLRQAPAEVEHGEKFLALARKQKAQPEMVSVIEK